MAKPHERLAAALQRLKAVLTMGRVAVRSRDLTRTEREILIRHGFLQSVIKGWYIPCQPGVGPGESTAWYSAFWEFCRDYLTDRFGERWALTPEQSLVLQAGNTTVPTQLLVRAEGANNQSTRLIHGTSLFEGAHKLPEPTDGVVMNGLRLFRTEAALVAAQPSFFENYPTEARTILLSLPDVSALLARLLSGGRTIVAGRLAGAFRNIGRNREADEILAAMRAADFRPREVDPFAGPVVRLPYRRGVSPYVHRIQMLWQTMREDIPNRFPPPTAMGDDAERYMRQVEEIYAADAYHSLSIEGYQVNSDLIERVRRGDWKATRDKADLDLENGLAARGYWQAFQAVKSSVRRVLGGENPGRVADDDHGGWYRELFAPKVAVGILKPESLAGYRSSAVYLRGSRHVPLNPEAVRDAMPVFFELLETEPEPSVRIVLGHFIFVYIHPYIDGNGRTARFLMNVMMAAAGYPWTVIPVQSRARYMTVLEAASVDQDIGPFADFLAAHIGQPAPPAP